jgi:glycosyltransferase involved in cell wall biosynthesis
VVLDASAPAISDAIIIIFDDDNKDDLYFIKDLIKNNKKIKLIINSKNLGVGKSRNIGIKFSTGSYVSFLDSDDCWHKNKLKYQYKFMKKNNYNFSHTAYLIIDENNCLVAVDYDTHKNIENKTKPLNYKAIIPTIENTPANQGDYYDGKKFVRKNYA